MPKCMALFFTLLLSSGTILSASPLFFNRPKTYPANFTKVALTATKPALHPHPNTPPPLHTKSTGVTYKPIHYKLKQTQTISLSAKPAFYKPEKARLLYLPRS